MLRSTSTMARSTSMMAEEKRVVVKIILEAVGDCEGKGLQPWVAIKDDVIVARFEAILEAQYALHEVGMEPVVLVEHHQLRPPLS